MAFGRRYLHAMESEDGSTTPFRTGGWRTHPQAPDTFVPLEVRFPLLTSKSGMSTKRSKLLSRSSRASAA